MIILILLGVHIWYKFLCETEYGFSVENCERTGASVCVRRCRHRHRWKFMHNVSHGGGWLPGHISAHVMDIKNLDSFFFFSGWCRWRATPYRMCEFNATFMMYDFISFRYDFFVGRTTLSTSSMPFRRKIRVHFDVLEREISLLQVFYFNIIAHCGMLSLAASRHWRPIRYGSIVREEMPFWLFAQSPRLNFNSRRLARLWLLVAFNATRSTFRWSSLQLLKSYICSVPWKKRDTM